METLSKKYPRSYHLPWSPGGTVDDKRMLDVSGLLGKPVVLTEKCDGSNLTYTRHEIFARSHGKVPDHRSFDLAKATHASIRYKIPDGLSVFCEYCYAVHSIEYVSLPSYSLVFGVRDDRTQEIWDWGMVEVLAEELGLPTVPRLGRGVINTSADLYQITNDLAQRPSVFGGTREGLVIRLLKSFQEEDFPKYLAKWVRKDHVQTNEHWTKMPVRPQKLDRSKGSCNKSEFPTSLLV